jgi:hypothetical protein
MTPRPVPRPRSGGEVFSVNAGPPPQDVACLWCGRMHPSDWKCSRVAEPPTQTLWGLPVVEVD